MCNDLKIELPCKKHSSFKKKLILFILCFTCSSGSVLSAKSWLLKEELLSQDVKDFDCHSSSIVETTPQNFCAVWKGGPGKGKSNTSMKENIGIWISTYDGNSWSTPSEIVSAPDSICWNPVICKALSGELLLFYRIGPNPRSVVSFLKRSKNGGATWSKEEILPAGIVGPTKNKPLFTSKGILVSPSSVEVGQPEDRFKATSCWIEISHDNGYSWKKIGPIELTDRKFGVIEPALFYDINQNMKMLCRDRANKIGEKGYIWTAISEDEGNTWSRLKKTSLPNPDSGLDVLDLGKGVILVFYNHSHTNRHPLNIAVSLDGGDSWSNPFCLSQSGEFPSAMLDSNKLIHVTYATTSDGNNQRKVKHVVIDPEKLIHLVDTIEYTRSPYP